MDSFRGTLLVALVLMSGTAQAAPKYRATLVESGISWSLAGLTLDNGIVRVNGIEYRDGEVFSPIPNDLTMRAHTRNDVLGYYTRSIFHNGLHTYAKVWPLRMEHALWIEQWRSFDLNERGDFVGVQSYINPDFGHDAHAVAYIDGKAVRIDPSNHDEFGAYTDSWAVGINNSRIVVGNEGTTFDKGSFTPNLYGTRAWKWENGVQTFIPLRRATDIADDGTILGNDFDADLQNDWEPHLVKGITKTKIAAPTMFFGDSLHGYEEFGMNNTGTVIGQYVANPTPNSSRWGAWVHQDGQTYDIYAITDGLPQAPAPYFYPSRINDLGQFTAFIKYGNTYYNYRFDPVPEPGICLAVGVGLAAFLRRRRAVAA